MTPEEYRQRAAYCAVAATRTGVPHEDVADAVHDMLLAFWEDGFRTLEPPKIAIRHRAIDAARRYGQHNRNTVRPEMIDINGIELAGGDTERIVESRLALAAVLAAMRMLRPFERKGLARKLNGERMSNLDSVGAYQARLKLRPVSW